MSVDTAEKIIQSVQLLKQIDELNLPAEYIGGQIVWPEVERMYQDARIVLLQDEVDTLDDEATQLTNDLMDSVAEREFLREDIKRLLDINARQAKKIQDLLAESAKDSAFLEEVNVRLGNVLARLIELLPEDGDDDYTGDEIIFDDYVENDDENVAKLQAEAWPSPGNPIPAQIEGAFAFQLWAPNADYKVGDAIVLADMQDSHWNGTYKLNESGVFVKAE